MAMNMQTKFVMVLEDMGFNVVKRGKYIVMGKENYCTADGSLAYFYIGKSGALRIGRNRGLSLSVRSSRKRLLLQRYEKLVPVVS